MKELDRLLLNAFPEEMTPPPCPIDADAVKSKVFAKLGLDTAERESGETDKANSAGTDKKGEEKPASPVKLRHRWIKPMAAAAAALAVCFGAATAIRMAAPGVDTPGVSQGVSPTVYTGFSCGIMSAQLDGNMLNLTLQAGYAKDLDGEEINWFYSMRIGEEGKEGEDGYDAFIHGTNPNDYGEYDGDSLDTFTSWERIGDSLITADGTVQSVSLYKNDHVKIALPEGFVAGRTGEAQGILELVFTDAENPNDPKQVMLNLPFTLKYNGEEWLSDGEMETGKASTVDTQDPEYQDTVQARSYTVDGVKVWDSDKNAQVSPPAANGRLAALTVEYPTPAREDPIMTISRPTGEFIKVYEVIDSSIANNRSLREASFTLPETDDEYLIVTMTGETPERYQAEFTIDIATGEITPSAHYKDPSSPLFCDMERADPSIEAYPFYMAANRAWENPGDTGHAVGYLSSSPEYGEENTSLLALVTGEEPRNLTVDITSPDGSIGYYHTEIDINGDGYRREALSGFTLDDIKQTKDGVTYYSGGNSPELPQSKLNVQLITLETPEYAYTGSPLLTEGTDYVVKVTDKDSGEVVVNETIQLQVPQDIPTGGGVLQSMCLPGRPYMPVRIE